MKTPKDITFKNISKEKGENQILLSEPWHVPEGGLIKQFVFGVEDGMLTTLGLITGVAGAATNSNIILVAGLVEMFAGAVSMAAGTFLSTKSQIEFYNQEIEREKKEIEEVPELERKEIKEIYKTKGFKGKELDNIVKKITSNKDTWLKIMMEEELGLIQSRFEKPKKAAIVMGFSFIFGAFIPLFPYLFLRFNIAITLSIILTVLVLFGVGAGKTILTKRNWFKSGLEMLFVGLGASVLAYFIGSFIGSLF